MSVLCEQRAVLYGLAHCCWRAIAMSVLPNAAMLLPYMRARRASQQGGGALWGGPPNGALHR